MISVCFQGKPFTITVIQVYAPTSNAEEAEQFYEDLPDLLELTPKKDVLFTIGIQFSSLLSFSHVRIFANPCMPGFPAHHQPPEFTQTQVQ